MMKTATWSTAVYRKILLPMSVIVVIWGVFGVAQMGRWGQGGYDVNTDGTVSHVEPGGPAARAGLEQHDVILDVDGAAGGRWWKKPYPGDIRAGEKQALVVERQGRTVTVEIVWEPLSGDARRSQVVEFFITTGFLACGLWALLASRTSGGALLAVFGLAYGAANFPGPGHALVAFVKSQLSLIYTAVLAHFLLAFPKPKKYFRTRMAVYLFYAPVVACLVFSVVAGLEYPALRSEHVWLITVTDLFYMILALAALVHSWFSMKRAEKRNSGLNWIPLGLAVAMGPFLVLALVRVAAPGFSVPGEDYMTLLGVAIPAGLALAVVKDARFRYRLENSV